MKRSRLVLVGALALGLAGTITAAANASGSAPSPGARPTVGKVTHSCPEPEGHAESVKLKVENGKIYLNGKVVGSVAEGDKITVALKDGKVYTGEEADALPDPETRPKPGPDAPRKPGNGSDAPPKPADHVSGTARADKKFGSGEGVTCVIK